MGSGDPSGLQNRRELASLALVSSTLTRFRHHLAVATKILRLAALAQDFGSRLRRRESASSSPHTLPPPLGGNKEDPSTRCARSGFPLVAQTPRKRLKFHSYTLPP